MDFKPIFRMFVCSDIHYGESDLHPENFDYIGQERDRFETAINFAYAYADAQPYNKVDAFAAVGDFVTSGREEEMLNFKASLDKVIRKETDITLAMASHEYFYDGVDNANERLSRIFGQQPVRHATVKGFHILGFSTDDRCQTGVEKQDWLAKELRVARDADPKKPIFLMYHPQFQNTVYGSAVLWRTANIMRITMNYPQVVSFSGHSHASVNDPRTVYQKHFTAFGTGSLISVSLCNADRLPIQTEVMGKGSVLIVEVDADNRVRVLPMDATNGKLFNEGWIVEKPSDPDTFIYTDARYERAKAPTFPDNVKFDAVYKEGRLTLSVTQATDEGMRVPGYQFVVKNDKGNIVRQFGICSGYYLYEMPDTADYTLDFDEGAGEFTVECYAQSFYDIDSEKIYTKFRV